MKSALTYVGWFLAAVASVAVVGIFVWGWRQTNEIVELRAQTDSLKQQIETLNIALSDKEAALSALQAKAAEQQAKLPDASGEAAKSTSGAASLLQKMMSAVTGGGKDEKASDDEQGNPLGALAKMYSGEQGKEMAKYSAEMAVNMHYQDLFANLHLPADVEQRLRDVLKENLAEQITAGLGALGGKASPETLKSMKDDSDAKLRAKVAEILSPEEMTAWDEYQATLPKRMLTQGLDMQFNMFAPGLAPDTRTRARDVLVEELLPTQAGQQGTGIPTNTDFQSQLTAQQEAFGRARERLAQELDETALAEVDRLIAQMQQMIEMSTRMMGNLKPPESTPK